MFSPRQIEPPKDSLLYGLRRRAPPSFASPFDSSVFHSNPGKKRLSSQRGGTSVRLFVVFWSLAAERRKNERVAYYMSFSDRLKNVEDGRIEARSSIGEAHEMRKSRGEGGRRTRGFFGNATRGTRDLCLARGRLTPRGDVGPSRLGRERYTLPALGSLAAFISERPTRRSEK